MATVNGRHAVAYCRNTKLTGYLRNLDLDSFDTIYIKRLRMAQYANQLPADKVWIDLTDSMGCITLEC